MATLPQVTELSFPNFIPEALGQPCWRVTNLALSADRSSGEGCSVCHPSEPPPPWWESGKDLTHFVPQSCTVLEEMLET